MNNEDTVKQVAQVLKNTHWAPCYKCNINYGYKHIGKGPPYLWWDWKNPVSDTSTENFYQCEVCKGNND